MSDSDLHQRHLLFAETNREARDKGILSIWTVFDHPSDFPHTFVARRFEAGKGTSGGPTDDVITGDLAMIRTSMEMCGLFRMQRAPIDPLNVIETWM